MKVIPKTQLNEYLCNIIIHDTINTIAIITYTSQRQSHKLYKQELFYLITESVYFPQFGNTLKCELDKFQDLRAP